MEKELVGVNRFFSDTDEGITIIYDKNGSQSGALLWEVINDYGSIEARYISLGGTTWDEPFFFGIVVKNWDGEGYFWIDEDAKRVSDFSNLDEGEEIVARYFRNFFNEDYFVAK